LVLLKMGWEDSRLVLDELEIVLVRLIYNL